MPGEDERAQTKGKEAEAEDGRSTRVGDAGSDASSTEFPCSTAGGTTFDGVLTLAERSLCPLKPLANSLCCVVANEDLLSEGLKDMGFSLLLPGKECSQIDDSRCPDLVAILIVAHGSETEGLTEIVQTLNKKSDAPPIVVALLMTGDRDLESAADGRRLNRSERDEREQALDLELGRTMESARAALYEAGADDTLCLYNGEPLRCYRLLEMLHKSELMAKRMGDIIEAEVEAAEQKAAQKMQSAYQKFLLMMPGTVLEAIPPEDPNLDEIRDDKGQALGIGDFEFTDKLGAGSFGHVFKAEHPGIGTCAVKVIAKAKATKNAVSLFSLDREICMLMHLDDHPNVVKAHMALHSKHYFYVVMDYAGRWNLQAFIKDYLGKNDAASLPAALTKLFLGQQATALSHLHTAMVCHRDLKPDNWIVNDEGDTLRLTDMGLAMQVVGFGQRLRQSCGSLPFCAPEVLSSEDESGSPGYDPFAADMWSLGVNWLELVQGPFSIERLLNWLPRHPSKKEKLIEGLEKLPQLWADVVKETKDSSGYGTVIAKMVVLRPQNRWKIAQVMGEKGINIITPQKPKSPLQKRPVGKPPSTSIAGAS